MTDQNEQLYRYTLHDQVLIHAVSSPPQFVQDSAPDGDLDLDALVASGDCFVALATILDQVDEALVRNGIGPQPELEKVISNLLYLQRYYRLSKKSSTPPHQ